MSDVRISTTRGERLSRHMMNRISGGRLVNKVNRWRPASETTAAVDDIMCFELVPLRKLYKTGFEFGWEETKEIYAPDLPFLYLVKACRVKR